MPQTRAKDQGPLDAVGFNGLDVYQFQPVTLAINQASTVVQASLFAPTAFKIYRVIAGFDASVGVAGTCSINIVAGTAAELTGIGSLPTPDYDYSNTPGGSPAGSQGAVQPPALLYPPAYAAPGQKLFLSDQPITMTANVATVLTPSDSAQTGAYPALQPGFAWDGIWGPGGGLITLRTVTNGSAAGKLYINLLVKEYDPTYAKPLLTAFNPAVDIP